MQEERDETVNKEERLKQQKRFDNIKHTVRRVEGCIEILVLTLAFLMCS